MIEAEKFSGTQIFDILNSLHKIYIDIENDQILWKCCEHFNQGS